MKFANKQTTEEVPSCRSMPHSTICFKRRNSLQIHVMKLINEALDETRRNGILEATNGLIQAAKRQARGYRSTKNLITMIYLIAGGLDLKATKLSE